MPCWAIVPCDCLVNKSELVYQNIVSLTGAVRLCPCLWYTMGLSGTQQDWYTMGLSGTQQDWYTMGLSGTQQDWYTVGLPGTQWNWYTMGLAGTQQDWYAMGLAGAQQDWYTMGLAGTLELVCSGINLDAAVELAWTHMVNPLQLILVFFQKVQKSTVWICAIFFFRRAQCGFVPFSFSEEHSVDLCRFLFQKSTVWICAVFFFRRAQCGFVPFSFSEVQPQSW